MWRRWRSGGFAAAVAAAIVVAGIVAIVSGLGGAPREGLSAWGGRASFAAAPRGSSFDDLALGRRPGEVVVAVTRDAADLEPQRLYVVALRSGRIRPLRVPVSRRCGAHSDQFPHRLDDGRLAFVRYCFGRVGSPVGKSVRLLVFDEATRQLRRFVPYQLPFFVGRFAIGRNGRGVINDGRGLSERLQWLKPARLQPLKTSSTRVGDPAWSPDGTRLAVATTDERDAPWAAPVRWSLRLLARDGKPVRKLLERVADPSRPSWSPDGRRIALRMTWNETPGLFVLDLADSRVRLVRRGATFAEVLWARDGKSLYATVSRARAARQPGLYEIDVR